MSITYQGREIIEKTCDLKRLILTEIQEKSLIDQYTKYKKPYHSIKSFKDYCGSDGEFYLVSIKKDFYKEVLHSHEDTGCLESLIFCDTGCGYNIQITSLRSWWEIVDEYLGSESMNGTKVVKSRNNRNFIYFFPTRALARLRLYSSEIILKNSTPKSVKFTNYCSLKGKCKITLLRDINIRENFWGNLLYPWFCDITIKTDNLLFNYYNNIVMTEELSWKVTDNYWKFTESSKKGNYYLIKPNFSWDEEEVEEFIQCGLIQNIRKTVDGCYVVYLSKPQEDKYIAGSIIDKLVDWLYDHKFKRTCSKAKYYELIESQIHIPEFVSWNVYNQIDKIISNVSGWKYGTPPLIKIEKREGDFPFTRETIYEFINNCYDYWINKK
jgi:hypothetical protein